MTAMAGVCRFCGCSEVDACVVDEILDVRGCSWIDVGRRVCSVCGPAAKAEGRALQLWRKAGWRTGQAEVRALHFGFVVGWFAVTSRSRYGRNPYRPLASVTRDAWDSGQRAGAEARRVQERTFGGITNEVRRGALVGLMGGVHVRAVARRRDDHGAPAASRARVDGRVRAGVRHRRS